VRIALDATYSLGENLSGVGVYSREILNGLVALDPEASWEWFYRSNRFVKALLRPHPPSVTARLLADTWGSRSADLFHGLNQRLPKRRFKKQIATFHDLFVLTGDYSTKEFRERFAAQAREAASAADLIIAVSAFTAGQVEDLLHVPASRIRVVHHGVVQRVLPNQLREKVVLCVGAIQRRKNQAGLIRAFRAMPSDWTLVLAGSRGFEAEEILRDVPADKRVIVAGYLTDEELSAWYWRASIFAFPSFDEGFGIPVLEAMAAGIPVIAGNRSSLPEVCGGAALLIDPASDDELADALNLLAHDERAGNSLVQKGLVRVRDFTWRHAAAKTRDIYRELL
jgi:glycosyltransferase involved in cell wall biosynthesis